MVAIPFVALLILICLGMPIGFALFAAAIGCLYVLGLAPLTLIPDLLYHSVQSFTLLAIPFFILAAELLSSGSLIERLFDVAEVMVGRWPGGMGGVSVVATGLFAGIQGSSAADAAAIGKIGTEGMVRQGYSPGFSASLIAAAGATAILIPPSIALLIYASLTNTSVGRLFFAGVVPGIITILVFIAYIVLNAQRSGWRYAATTRFSWSEKLSRVKRAFWILILPFFILYGFYTGIFTATEIGTITVFYSAALSLLVYRTLNLSDIWPVLTRCAETTVKLFFIIASAILFSKVLTFLQLPQMAFTFIQRSHLPPWGFLLAASGVLFIMGMFMEAVSLNVMTTPILAPIATHLGIDPVHYGIVLILNIEIALITPPVGLNLFVLAGATRVPLVEMYKNVWPFIIILVAMLLLIIFVPSLSLLLPKLLLGS